MKTAVGRRLVSSSRWSPRLRSDLMCVASGSAPPRELDEAGEPIPEEQIADVLASAFSKLHQAPKLKSLAFLFDSWFLEDSPWQDDHPPSENLRMQWKILQAIADNPEPLPALVSLKFEHLLSFKHELYASPHFAALLSKLQHLHLDVLCDDGESAYSEDPMMQSGMRRW